MDHDYSDQTRSTHHHHHTLIGDIKASLHHSPINSSNPSGSNEKAATTSPTKKIVLKRTRLGTPHDNTDHDDDSIKKSKMS